MPSGNWSFPCSPRNPAKVREELRLLAQLAPAWRLRGLPWSPRSGAQLEFGRELRRGAGVGSRSEAASDTGNLHFQTQAEVLTEDNLRWTARARFGTYKFFGFVFTDQDGYAQLTPAGERFISAAQPGEVLLRQLLKWQYPDNQHRGARWPATDFAIHPFLATARLIHELGGLTRQEIALFCFTMRRTEDAAATAEAIRRFRQRREQSAGRTGKARAAHAMRELARARYETEGKRVVLGSTDDYADALVRYFRYTTLFSVRGARIVVASGRESELEELIYPAAAAGLDRMAAGARRSAAQVHTTSGSGWPAPLQLMLGEAPPVRLAAPIPLFSDYEDAGAFYTHFGNATLPHLPWEDPARLAAIARDLSTQIDSLRASEAHLRSGRSVLTGPERATPLPDSYEALSDLVFALRRRKQQLEQRIYEHESGTPQRLAEALDAYTAILRREVIDPPTFLEWNTWRVFLALGQAREIVPHLTLDDDLQPLSPAQGNQPDLEIDYGGFVVVAEATLRTGTDQRQAEARPVTRHVLEVQRREASRRGMTDDETSERPCVYGLFLAPKIHMDTATDFFVALKYRVIERRQVVAIPLTLRQFGAALRPFASPDGHPGSTASGGLSWAGGPAPFSAGIFRALLDACYDAALAADTGEEWLVGIAGALRRWLQSLGAPAPSPEAPAAVPLPLFA